MESNSTKINFAKNKRLTLAITLFLFLASVTMHKASADTIHVNSLIELQPYLDDNNVIVALAPGDYYVTVADVANERIGKLWNGAGTTSKSYDILQFSGNASIYDFTGVTIYIENKTAQQHGRTELTEIRTLGNNTTIKNITLVDEGDIHDAPSWRANSVVMDGANNILEGCHFTVKGSSPYGYGDMFGKGGNKRCAILVRGNANTVKNCTVIHRAFGHGIYMQAANDAVIDGCYVEGELRTTDEVIAEDGTGSYADERDFETTYGFNLRDDIVGNYYFSYQEDGIRVYNAGETVIDGVEYSRGTTNLTVVNCTVIKMRSGVNIGGGKGKQYVENCTALATESNFWVQSDAQVINCRGDASVGAFYSEDVARSNASIELTLLDNYVTPLDGETTAMYFAGSGHNITIHDGTTSFDNNIEIYIGEARLGYRFMWDSDNEPYDHNASNITFTNNTKYPVFLGDKASNNTIYSCGTVTDNGSGNTINQLTDCDYVRPCNNTADNLQAECHDNMSGVQTEPLGDKNELTVTDIHSGDWISFNDIDLTNMAFVTAIAATNVDGTAIEVREDSTNGTLLATILLSGTSGFDAYQEFSASLDQTVNDSVNLYFVFTGPDGLLMNLDKISFATDPCAEASYDAYSSISAGSFCASSNVVVEVLSGRNKIVSDINEGDYLRFSNVEFGDGVYNAVNVFASSATEGGTIEIRSDALDGTLLATVDVPGTGSWDRFEKFVVYPDNNISGTHDIYLVFKGSEGLLMKVDDFFFMNDPCKGKSFQAFDQIEAENYCEMNGARNYGTYVGDIQIGDWIRFGSVDFTSSSPTSVRLNMAGTTSNGFVNIMLDDPLRGNLVATSVISDTGGSTSWKSFLRALNQEITGVHDVYVYFGESGNNLNWIQFSNDSVKGQTDPYVRFEAEFNDDESGVVSVTTSDVDGDKDVSQIEDADYVMFKALNLKDADSLYARVASAVAGGVIEVRLGAVDGDIIAFVDVPGTGSSDTWQTVSTKLDNVEGENDVYFVFRGEGSDLFKLNWLQFTRYESLFPRLEAEDNDSSYGNFLTGATTDAEDDGLGSILRFTYPGNWVQFADVDLTGAKSVNARFCTSYDDAYIEVRINAPDGELIGTIELGSTGSFSTWGTASDSILSVSGVHDVYFVYQTETSSVVCGSNWFQFSGLSLPETKDPTLRIEAEDYDRAGGTVTVATTDVDGERELASIQNEDWILFKNINLTDLTSLDVRVASPYAGSRIEARLDAYDGQIFSYLFLPNTGSSTDWTTFNATLFSIANGVHDVYLLFKGASADFVNINWLQFKSVSSGLSNTSFEQEITLYPNPVGDYLVIEGNANSNIEIFNVMGQKVFEDVLTGNSYTVSTTDLKPGVYIVKLKNKESIKSGKILKK